MDTGVALAGLVVAGVAVTAALGASLPVREEGVAVSITSAGTLSAPGRVAGVGLRVEVADDALAALYGYRSMTSTVDVDCRNGKDRVSKATAFDGADLTGRRQARVPSGEWVAPSPNAYMTAVIEVVCKGGAPGPVVAASEPAAVQTAAQGPVVSASAPPRPTKQPKPRPSHTPSPGWTLRGPISP